MPAPHYRWYRIECVVTHREILEVSVVAGHDDGCMVQIKFGQERTNQFREHRNHLLRRFVILRVADLVGDEVFIKREAVTRDNSGQDRGRLFRTPQADGLATFTQQSISEIVKDGPPGFKILNQVEA